MEMLFWQTNVEDGNCARAPSSPVLRVSEALINFLCETYTVYRKKYLAFEPGLGLNPRSTHYYEM
jgi:hypothetical protein